MSLGGVDYTVEVLAIVSDTDDYLDLSLRTDPLLPRGQDLWLELEHVDGSTAVFAIDTATVEAPGYRWRAVYAGEDRHGWGTDSADADMDPDSVTVRLSTGAPTITGTAQVGQTLTAVTTGITDAEGVTSATYTYQWIQVNGTAADIAGENSSTYTLVDADLGKAIKVKVSFTDDVSNAETRTSAATATVTAAATTSVSGVLVSNVGQGQDENWSVVERQSQAFTTDAGATLSSVEIISEDAEGHTVTVSLCTVDGSSHPTSRCTALSAPSSFAAGTLVFTAPGSTTLAANTTYSLLMTAPGGAVTLDATDSNGEDSGGAASWSIANALHYERTPNVWEALSDTSYRITIKGTLGTTTVSTNNAPTVANAIQDQTATAGTALSYAFPATTFNDADSDTLTYTATQSDDTALPSWLSFAPTTRTFSGTPANHGRGDGLGEGDGERRHRLGQRHLRHRGLGGGGLRDCPTSAPGATSGPQT